MGNNLTCYMRMKVALITFVSVVLIRVLMDYVGYNGFLAKIVDYGIPIYLLFAIIQDYYKLGYKIKSILFDIIIAINLWFAYFIALVVVGYTFDFIIGFFKYVIF